MQKLRHIGSIKDLRPQNTQIRVRGYFSPELSGCYAILTSPKEGETAVYGYNPGLF